MSWQSQIIGLPVSKLTNLLSPYNLVWRVVKKDGKALPTTRDLNPNRINVDVANGVVVKFSREGGRGLRDLRGSGLKINGTHLLF